MQLAWRERAHLPQIYAQERALALEALNARKERHFYAG